MREFDAVLIHGQGYKNRPELEEGPRPSIHGRLEIDAAKHLGEKGIIVNNYVFSGFAFPGQDVSLAQIDADDLILRAKIDPSHVVVDESARTTSMELEAFRRIAHEKGWKNRW